ncbi:MAG: D-aminoacylase [Steroidobacteraceae bacterium]
MPPSILRADVVLKGGLVIDGSGQPGFAADVAVSDDTIVAIGDVSRFAADRVIDVSGLAVAPGFIDVHTHDDLICITQPDMTPKISQGITTLIVGNCGISAAPLRFHEGVSEPFNLLGQQHDFAYDTFASYRKAIEIASPRVNVAALIGHSTLRMRCVEDLDRPATASELEQMNMLLRQALDQGAVGMSSGVFYAPAQAADVNELTALARTVGHAGAVCTAHIRDEREHMAEALQEAFAATRPRTPLILSHLKCAGVRNWGKAAETLRVIDAARQTQPVHFDCYPYTAGSTVIRPDLADGEVEILINWSTPHPEMAGRALKTIAEEWGMTQAEAAERLMPGGASYFQMHEQDMREIMQHSCCMIGSDGLPHDSLPHPRLWGTFPRVLGRYARDLKTISLETAVHKMTGLSAATFSLPERGLIAVGMKADVTVFNPETVIDRATYAAPAQLAEGIVHVFVNGRLSWTQNGATPGRSGRFLARG